MRILESEGVTKANHTAALWMVEDVEETIKDLSKKGIEFEHYHRSDLKTNERGIANMNGTKSAWFKDSEGNILAISSLPE